MISLTRIVDRLRAIECTLEINAKDGMGKTWPYAIRRGLSASFMGSLENIESQVDWLEQHPGWGVVDKTQFHLIRVHGTRCHACDKIHDMLVAPYSSAQADQEQYRCPYDASREVTISNSNTRCGNDSQD